MSSNKPSSFPTSASEVTQPVTGARRASSLEYMSKVTYTGRLENFILRGLLESIIAEQRSVVQ